MAPEDLLERVADLADRSPRPGSVDGCGQEVSVAGRRQGERSEGFPASLLVPLRPQFSQLGHLPLSDLGVVDPENLQAVLDL